MSPIRIPLPQVGLDATQTPQVPVSGGVVPQRNLAPQQIQEAGQALQGAGEVATGIATVLQEERDLAASKEAFAEWSEQVTRILHDPEQGYLHTQGKDALGDRRARAFQEIEDARRRLTDGMGSSVARGMFEEVARSRMPQIQGRVYNHEAAQTRIYHIGRTEALAQQFANDAVLAVQEGEINYDLAQAGDVAARMEATERASLGGPQPQGGPADPLVPPPETRRPAWRDALEDYETQIREGGRLQGLSGQQITEALREGRTQVYSRMIQVLIDGDRIDEAERFIEQIPETKVVAGAFGQFRQTLTKARQKRDAFLLADDLYSGYSEPEPMPADQEPEPGVEIQGPPAPRSAYERDAQAVTTPGGQFPGVRGDRSTSDLLTRAWDELSRRVSENELTPDQADQTFSRLARRHELEMRAVAEDAAQWVDRMREWAHDNPGASTMEQMPEDMQEAVRGQGLWRQMEAILAPRQDALANLKAQKRDTFWMAEAYRLNLRGAPRAWMAANVRPFVEDRTWTAIMRKWEKDNDVEAADKSMWPNLNERLLRALGPQTQGGLGLIDGRGDDGTPFPDGDLQQDIYQRAKSKIIENYDEFKLANPGKEPDQATVRDWIQDVISTTVEVSRWGTDRVNMLQAEAEGFEPEEMRIRVGGRTLPLPQVTQADIFRFTQDETRIATYFSQMAAQHGEQVAEQLTDALVAELEAHGWRNLGGTVDTAAVRSIFARHGLNDVTPTTARMAETLNQALTDPLHPLHNTVRAAVEREAGISGPNEVFGGINFYGVQFGDPPPAVQERRQSRLERENRRGSRPVPGEGGGR